MDQATMTDGNVKIRDVTDDDRDAVIEIFNYYVSDGFAAYPGLPVTRHFFSFLREGASPFCVLEAGDRIVGFGLVKQFLPFDTFRKTGALTYFILPSFTRHGLGTRLLAHLTREAHDRGMEMLVINTASKNSSSIGFHTKNGFIETGRLRNVGVKQGEPFDIVWMQKDIRIEL